MDKKRNNFNNGRRLRHFFPLEGKGFYPPLPSLDKFLLDILTIYIHVSYMVVIKPLCIKTGMKRVQDTPPPPDFYLKTP